MIFLKHFRQYYLKYFLSFFVGIVVLVAIDWYQLEIPRTIKTIIDQVENLNFTQISDIFPSLLYIVLIVLAYLKQGKKYFHWFLKLLCKGMINLNQLF